MNSSDHQVREGFSFIWLLVSFLLWMIIAVIWYFNYPSSTADRTFLGFILIFLRELIVLGAVIMAALYVLINKRKGPKRGNKL